MRVTKAWTSKAEKALWSWTTEMMVSSGFPNMKTTSSNASRYVSFLGTFLYSFSALGLCPHPTHAGNTHTPFHFPRSMNSSNLVGSTKVLPYVSANTKMEKQPWSRKRRRTCQRSSSRRRSAPVTCINASKVGRFTRSSHSDLYSRRCVVQIPLLSGQNRMVSTMLSASKILRAAWNCGISYSKCKACERTAVVRGFFSHFPTESSLKDQSA